MQGTAFYEEGTQYSREAASTLTETICNEPSMCTADATRSKDSADQDTMLPGVEDLGVKHGGKVHVQNENAERVIEMRVHNLAELCVCTHKASSSKWRTPENVVESESCEVQRTPLKTSMEADTQSPSR